VPSIPAEPRPDDLAGRLTSRLVDVVESLTNKVFGPLQLLGAAVVYGLLVLTAGAVGVLLLLDTVVRLFSDYLVGRNIWIPYLFLGLVCLAAGSAVWRRRPKLSS
jgi:hypothetical protein